MGHDIKRDPVLRLLPKEAMPRTFLRLPDWEQARRGRLWITLYGAGYEEVHAWWFAMSAESDIAEVLAQVAQVPDWHFPLMAGGPSEVRGGQGDPAQHRPLTRPRLGTRGQYSLSHIQQTVVCCRRAMERHIIAYVRVSTEEQADSRLGLDAQRSAILAEASRRGWTESEITFIEDAGYTAKNLNRPGIRTALQALQSGDADTLVVAKLDRLTRSMSDFTGLLQAAAKHRWALVALDLQVDTTTPNGEAMAYVVAVFANLERRLISERTKAGLEEAARRGVRLGRPSRLPVEVADRIARERAEGRTLQAIADGLTNDQIPGSQGGLRWHPSTVRAVLRSLSEGHPRSNRMAPRIVRSGSGWLRRTMSQRS